MSNDDDYWKNWEKNTGIELCFTWLNWAGDHDGAYPPCSSLRSGCQERGYPNCLFKETHKMEEDGAKAYKELKEKIDRLMNNNGFWGKLAGQLSNKLEKIGSIMHYPRCWDTASYPTLESAIHEIFKCTNQECQEKESEVEEPDVLKKYSRIEVKCENCTHEFSPITSKIEPPRVQGKDSPPQPDNRDWGFFNKGVQEMVRLTVKENKMLHDIIKKRDGKGESDMIIDGHPFDKSNMEKYPLNKYLFHWNKDTLKWRAELKETDRSLLENEKSKVLWWNSDAEKLETFDEAEKRLTEDINKYDMEKYPSNKLKWRAGFMEHPIRKKCPTCGWDCICGGT